MASPMETQVAVPGTLRSRGHHYMGGMEREGPAEDAAPERLSGRVRWALLASKDCRLWWALGCMWWTDGSPQILVLILPILILGH